MQYLVDNGVRPSNIYLVGDSAGGNLILQVLAHALHPIPSVPRLKLSEPLAGAYLMSPWVALASIPDDPDSSMITNDDCDMIGPDALFYWASRVLDADLVANEAIPYLEPLRASRDWFTDVAAVVDRVLISAGDKECLRDVIIRFGQALCSVHPRARLIVQEHGVHDDPQMDFMLPVCDKVEVEVEVEDKGKAKTQKTVKVMRDTVKVGALTPVIIGWLAEGWKKS